MAEHGTLAVNGLQFTSLAAGPQHGEPVILLHGFPQFADMWSPLLEVLGDAGYRAFAPDQRGYSAGARPADGSAYTQQKLTADVLGMADAQGWRTFHLIGHDWGGLLAWKLAAEHPDRLRSLTVLSTPHPNAFLGALRSDPDQRRKSRYILLFRMPGHVAEALLLFGDGALLRRVYGGKVPPEQVAANVGRLAQPGALTAALNWYRVLELDARIAPVQVPTLYLWGDGDVALGRAAAEATAAHVQGPYRFEALAGCSHWLLEDARERIASHVLEHLRTARFTSA